MGEAFTVGVDEREGLSIGREACLTDRDSTGYVADVAVLERQQVRRPDFLVLEIKDVVGDDIEGAEVIVDAAQMRFTPDPPSGFACPAIGELDYFAGACVQAIELDESGSLAVEDKKAPVLCVAGDEIVERIAIRVG